VVGLALKSDLDSVEGILDVLAHSTGDRSTEYVFKSLHQSCFVLEGEVGCMGHSLNSYRTRFHWSGVGEEMLSTEVKASDCSKMIKFRASATVLEALDNGIVTARVEQLWVRGNPVSLYKSRNETSNYGCELRLQFRNNWILKFLERRRAVSE
jgi:hypothetical protein